jgi:hypothetical protein
VSHWIIIGIAVVLVGGYVALIIWAHRKQRAFEEEYEAAKQRHEVFVLIKRTVRKKPESGLLRFVKVKTYEVVGRMNVFQSIKGMQMSRMQTVTLQTTKGEYRKIEVNHSYKMDVAGNFIGNVLARTPNARSFKKGVAAWGNAVMNRVLRRKAEANDSNKRGGKRRKAKKTKSK